MCHTIFSHESMMDRLFLETAKQKEGMKKMLERKDLADTLS